MNKFKCKRTDNLPEHAIMDIALFIQIGNQGYKAVCYCGWSNDTIYSNTTHAAYRFCKDHLDLTVPDALTKAEAFVKGNPDKAPW